MKHKDILSAIIAGRGIVTWVTLAGILVGVILISVFGLGFGWSIIGICSFLLILANSLVIVQPGNAGYLKVFEVLQNKSYPAGLHFVVPFISTMKEVDIRLQEHRCTTETKKNKNLREVKIEYVLNYRINENLVHLLHRYIGEDKYLNTALCPWLETSITDVVSQKEYSDINGKIKELQHEIQAAFLDKVKAECIALNTEAEELFAQLSVSIQSIDFDAEYTKSISELAVADNEIKIVEKRKEQKIIIANAKAEALKIEAEAEAAALKVKAEAEAEALKMKGASENEVKEKLGEILKTHPELLKDVLAKNFPKVYGGSNIINLDDLLSGASN